MDLSALITVVVLMAVILYILIKGIPNLNPGLFEWEYTTDNRIDDAGLLSIPYRSRRFSLLIAVPFGIFSAIYLVEYAKRGSKLVELVRLTTETLSGIPSIVLRSCSVI